MKHFVRKHKKKIIVGHGIATVLFLLSTTLLMSDDDAVMFFTPNGSTVLLLRETVDVDVQITTKIPLNAVGATMTFPTDVLEIVGISKRKSFLDLWTEDTIIRSEAGEVVFSGGTLAPGGLVGSGTVLTVTLRAKKVGDATLELHNTQALAGDGKGTAIRHVARSITFTIPEVAISAPSGGGSTLSAPTPTSASADLDADGKVTMRDASILLVHFLRPYDIKYDLDMNGSIGMSDLSIVLSKF
jgi:hypothetical protein